MNDWGETFLTEISGSPFQLPLRRKSLIRKAWRFASTVTERCNSWNTAIQRTASERQVLAGQSNQLQTGNRVTANRLKRLRLSVNYVTEGG